MKYFKKPVIITTTNERDGSPAYRYARAVAGNGRLVIDKETYKSREECVEAANSANATA